MVAATKFPEGDYVQELLAKGVARQPDALWIVYERAADLKAKLVALGAETMELPKVKAMHRPEVWRNCELLHGCSQVLIFHEPNSSTTKWWADMEHRPERLFIVVRGEKRKAKRRGRARV